MDRIIAGIILLCLAACTANRSLGFASYLYEIGYESGCARAYVETGPPPWPQDEDTGFYWRDQLFREGWQKGHTICIDSE